MSARALSCTGTGSLSLDVDAVSVARDASTAAVRIGGGVRAAIAARAVTFGRAGAEVTSTVALAATGTVGAYAVAAAPGLTIDVWRAAVPSITD